MDMWFVDVHWRSPKDQGKNSCAIRPPLVLSSFLRYTPLLHFGLFPSNYFFFKYLNWQQMQSSHFYGDTMYY